MLNLLAVCNVYWLVHYKSYVKIACDVKGIYIFYNFSTLPVTSANAEGLQTLFQNAITPSFKNYGLETGFIWFRKSLSRIRKKKKLEKTVSTGPSLNSKLLIQKSGGE